MKELLELNPIICAIKGDAHLEDAANSDGDIVFLLNEDILTLKEKIQILHEHNKKVFVHIDMITGLSSSPIAVDYMKKEFNLDGIITTKTNIVKRAIELDLKVVQRFFFISLRAHNQDHICHGCILHEGNHVASERFIGITPHTISTISKISRNLLDSLNCTLGILTV